MSTDIVINQVIKLFILMVIGFAAKKAGMLTREVNRKLSDLLLNVTSPAIVVISFSVDFSKEMLISAATVLAFCFCIFLLSMLLSEILFGRYKNESTKKILKYVTVYSNCGYMGIPVLGSLFGKEGVFYASIFIMVFNLFVWTNGVAIFTGQKDFKTMRKALINPGIISVLIGTVIFLFSIKLPGPVYDALDTVGSMTVPLSMLIIGALMADIEFKTFLKGFSVYYSSFIRLLAIPAATIVFLALIGFPGRLIGPCAVLVAMPAAVNTAIFSEKFGGDSALASKCISLSTLFSILTIPFIYHLSQSATRYIPVIVRLF